MFSSKVYPYQLLLPPEVLKSDWASAKEAWDGQARIDHGDAHTDWVTIDDGDLFVFGGPWPGTLDELYQREQQAAVRDHACSDPPDEMRQLEIGSDEAILHTQSCQGAFVAKVAMLHAGTALVVTELVWQGNESAAVDRLIERLASLRWVGQ